MQEQTVPFRSNPPLKKEIFVSYLTVGYVVGRGCSMQEQTVPFRSSEEGNNCFIPYSGLVLRGRVWSL